MATKKIHVLPNAITAFGLSCGLFIIFKMSIMPSGHTDYATLLSLAGVLLIASIADALDGAVARAVKAESEFGFFFDSLSDGITFGVAPSIIILKSIKMTPGSELSFLMMSAAMVYSVCGVLRLVRFNVLRYQSRGDIILETAHKKHFTGLPIPAAAAAAVSANLIFFSEEFKHFFNVSDSTRMWILFTQLLVLGYFMVSRWKFPSIKTLHVKVGSFEQIFFVSVLTVLIFYGVIYHFPVIFFLISWGYVLVAWILSIIRLLSGKNSETLKEFEPDDDPFDDIHP